MTTAAAVKWLSNGVTSHAFPLRRHRAPSLCGYAWKPQVPRKGGAVCVRCQEAAK